MSTNEDVVAFVSYGESTNYTSNEADQYYNNLKTIRLSKLKAGTTYHYRVKVIDKSGNATVSTDAVLTTLPLNQISNSKTLLQSATDIEESISKLIESALPSITPPFISTPEISNVTENSATVKWDTNISAFGSVRYATDENYTASSSYGLTASAGQNKELHHSVDLTGLIPNTVYHLQATSYVFPQALGKSPDLVLTTQTAKIKAGVSQKDINSFTIDWSTPDVTTSIIDYKNLTTGEFNHVTDDTFKTYHSVKLSNLTPGTTYVVKVSGINSIGNIVRSGSDLTVMTPFDTVPPIISNFKVDDALVPGNSDFVQTIIGWQTDKPANSAIYYAEGAGTASSTDKDLTNKLELLRDYTNNHILILPSMKAGMVYRIKIVSIDRSGNLQKLGPMTIVTPRQTQSVLDIIFKNFEETFRFLRSPGQQ